MEKLIYFKGTHLVTPEQQKEIVEMFGDGKSENPNHYISFTKEDVFHDSNSGLHEYNNLMLYISCGNQRLNERYDALVERIKTKGFTASKAYYSDYVEENLAKKLIVDAIEAFNKEFTEEPLLLKYNNYYSYIIDEFMRNLGFPKKCWQASILNDLEEAKAKIQNSKIDTFDAVTCPDADVIMEEYTKHRTSTATTVFKEYYFNLKKGFSGLETWNNKRDWFDKYPFLCKLLQSSWSSDCEFLMINVYDRATSHKAVKIILTALIEKGKITKDSFVWNDSK